MKIASFYLGHNANAAFYTPETGYRIIELERYYRKRYFSLLGESKEKVINTLRDCLSLAKTCWGIDNDFDICVFGQGPTDLITNQHRDVVSQVVVSKKYVPVHHHVAHIACAFAQSPYRRAVVISYDGGGSDGSSKFVIKQRSENSHQTISLGEQGCFEAPQGFTVMRPSPTHGEDGEYIINTSAWNINLGLTYNAFAYPISEIKNNKGDTIADLALAGKLMGLSAYGREIPALRESIKRFMLMKDGWLLVNNKGPQFEMVRRRIAYEPRLEVNSLSGKGALDLAYNAQAAFEESFEELTSPVIFAAKQGDEPIVMTGGCSLNVLVNEKLRKDFHNKMFVAPNVDDGGLAFGQMCEVAMPSKQVNITYNGLPILDKQDLPKAVQDYGAQEVTPAELAKLCKDGKIIGICVGDSEVGPRALGNRSIICDPSYPEMKDILNAKVKFREYFRPFAPFMREERANEIFEISEDGRPTANMRFMSFAPMVRPKWRDKLPAITHVDGTARLQTVTEDSHKLFNDILIEFEKISDHGVLLNTSFNIKGLPILTRVADALHILDNTEIDHVYIEGYLFSKKDA